MSNSIGMIVTNQASIHREVIVDVSNIQFVNVKKWHKTKNEIKNLQILRANAVRGRGGLVTKSSKYLFKVKCFNCQEMGHYVNFKKSAPKLFLAENRLPCFPCFFQSVTTMEILIHTSIPNIFRRFPCPFSAARCGYSQMSSRLRKFPSFGVGWKVFLRNDS